MVSYSRATKRIGDKDMTRQDQIAIASCAYGSKGSSIDFTAGAKWADAHPISPWISVKDKLPCDEKDMVIEYVAGLELRTKKVGVLLEGGFIDITYMYSFPPNGWHWNICDAITHWFPIPEPPKE